MTMPVEDPPNGALERLREIGSDKVRDFLLANARNAQFRDHLNRIPNRKGFRGDSDGNIRHKCLQLAKALVGEESSVEQLRANSLYDSLWQIIADGRLSAHWSTPQPLRKSEGSVDELLLRINEDPLHRHSRDEVRDVLKFAPFELPKDLEAQLELLPTANDLVC